MACIYLRWRLHSVDKGRKKTNCEEKANYYLIAFTSFVRAALTKSAGVLMPSVNEWPFCDPSRHHSSTATSISWTHCCANYLKSGCVCRFHTFLPVRLPKTATERSRLRNRDCNCGSGSITGGAAEKAENRTKTV